MKQKSSLLQKKFGERLKEQRNKLSISQEELGFRSGLDRTYISGIERGTRNPSLKNLGRIAKALKIPLKELLE